jgi:hypothetical protein
VSRQNACINPACGANVTGWGGGSTPTRSTGLASLPVTTGAHYTANGFVQGPDATAAPGQTWTISVYVQNNTGFALGTKNIYAAWHRSAGGDDFSAASGFSLPTGTTRMSVTGTAPANTTGLFLVLDSLNATFGTGVEVTALLYEQVGSLDSYFDGNTASASWDGVAENSSSTLTTTVTVTSDLDLRWQIANTVTSDLDLRWRIFNTVTSDLDLRWTVTQRVLSDLTLKWNTGTVIATATTDGSAGWYQLRDFAVQARTEREQEGRDGPLSCPNDGEPLLRNPGSGRLGCPFDGWQRPEG